MTRLYLSSAIIGLMTLAACEGDFGTKTVTYTRATAIYGDLEELRATPLLGTAKAIVDPGKIFVYHDLLLVGEEGHGIHVIDNADPVNPVPLSFLNIPGNREFFISEDFLYAESLYDMLKIDVSNIQQAQIVERVNNAFLETLTNDRGEAIIGFNYEEVTQELKIDDPIFDYEADHNVYFYDIDNSLIPPSAVPASFAGNSGSGVGSVNRIVAYDGYVYAVSKGKMNVFDSRAGFQQVLSESMGWNMETVFPMGDRLFVGSSSSVDIYDISNRERPNFLSSYWHMTSCDPVLPVNESTAYVTLRTGDFSECPGDENELLVIDISSNEIIEEIQEILMDSPYGMTLIGDKLYVGEGSYGMSVFDASDRRNLQLIKRDQTVEAFDVLAHPTRSDVLLMASADGLVQYQLDINQNLQLISHIEF